MKNPIDTVWDLANRFMVDPKYVHLNDEKIKEVAERLSNKLPLRVAVLAAMNITGELFKERGDKEKKLLNIEERSQSLLEQLDSVVGREEI